MFKSAVKPDVKNALVALLRRGQITQSEAARIAGLSRQAVGQWIDDDLAPMRERYLMRLLEKAVEYQEGLRKRISP